MKMRKLIYSITLLMAIAAFGQAFAEEQNGQEKELNDKNTVSTQALGVLVAQHCFSSGSGWTFLKVCITDNGNISWFESPAGKVHLQNREGYAVCSNLNGANPATVHGFDTNIAANGWGTAVVSQPNGAGTLPLLITRQSLDGYVQLKQTFTINSGQRGVDVRTDIKNISGVVLPSVVMTRYFDGDIDGNAQNQAFFTAWGGSMWLQDTGHVWGLMLTGATSTDVNFLWTVSKYANWDPFGAGSQNARGCNFDSVPFASTGNFVGGLHMALGDLNPGQTRSPALLYRRF
jgi:hypothetical protein